MLRSEISYRCTSWRLRNAHDNGVRTLVAICPNLVALRIGGKEGAAEVTDAGGMALAALPRLQQVRIMSPRPQGMLTLRTAQLVFKHAAITDVTFQALMQEFDPFDAYPLD